METETRPESLAAFDAAQALLAAMPTAELLTAAYALTHRMGDTAKDVRGLRQQRDMITAEVLRRTGTEPRVLTVVR